MKGWVIRIIGFLKRWFDKWLKNRIKFKVNQENNKHDTESSKIFHQQQMDFVDKILGKNFLEKDSKNYQNIIKAYYQNDSKERKVIIETETNQNDGKIRTIYELNNKKETQGIENKPKKDNIEVGEDTDGINFYKKTNKTEEEYY
ncbi:MAG: hypothetical protein REH79_01615 [Spiroplasma sp.]|nr:hypothetical protein [Spiroplasma sp.]